MQRSLGGRVHDHSEGRHIEDADLGNDDTKTSEPSSWPWSKGNATNGHGADDSDDDHEGDIPRTRESMEAAAFFDDFLRSLSPAKSTKETWMHRFNLSIGLVIFTNSIVIAVETDMRPSGKQDVAFVYLEHFFVGFFVFELSIRLYMEHFRYFCSPWNWLDFVCVMGSVLDVWLLPAISSSGGSGALRSLSVLRVLRLLRVVRLLRLFRMFHDLYIILQSFAASLRSIFWVTVLMALGNFFCSILVTQLIGQNSYFADVQIGDDDIDMRFGTVPRSMYSLFELLMLEGWNEVGRPLVERSPWMALFFLSFFMIFTFGLLNMIVGGVVEQTMSHSKENDTRMQKIAEKEMKRVVMGLKDIFLRSDKDGNGVLSYDEFREAIQNNPEVAQVLEKTDIPADQWEDLFDILDVDGDASLSVEEFLRGILRVRGTARNRDLVATHMTVSRLLNHTQRLLEDVKEVRKDGDSTSQRLASIEALVGLPAEEPRATQPLKTVGAHAMPPRGSPLPPINAPGPTGQSDLGNGLLAKAETT